MIIERIMSIANARTQSLLSIQDFACELRKLPASSFEQVDAVQRFLSEHPVDPESLSPYLVWDRQHYTRNLIDKNNLYELVAICWEVGQASSIHNRRDQNCWMAAPLGILKVQNYRVLAQNIDAGTCEIETTDTLEMNPSNPVAVDPQEPVHRVYNPAELKQRAVSLHIYSRPFDTCVVYSDQQGTCGVIKLHYTTQYGH